MNEDENEQKVEIPIAICVHGNVFLECAMCNPFWRIPEKETNEDTEFLNDL